MSINLNGVEFSDTSGIVDSKGFRIHLTLENLDTGEELKMGGIFGDLYDSLEKNSRDCSATDS